MRAHSLTRTGLVEAEVETRKLFNVELDREADELAEVEGSFPSLRAPVFPAVTRLDGRTWLNYTSD